MISFIVDSSDFEEEMNYARSEFQRMAQTLIDVAHLIELNTRPLVPYEYGELESSFNFVIVENNPNLIELELGYDAIDERDGYHYAEYQHEGINWRTGSPLHYQRATATDHFLVKGIQLSENEVMVEIEKDYMSLFRR